MYIFIPYFFNQTQKDACITLRPLWRHSQLSELSEQVQQAVHTANECKQAWIPRSNDWALGPMMGPMIAVIWEMYTIITNMMCCFSLGYDGIHNQPHHHHYYYHRCIWVRLKIEAANKIHVFR